MSFYIIKDEITNLYYIGNSGLYRVQGLYYFGGTKFIEDAHKFKTKSMAEKSQ